MGGGLEVVADHGLDAVCGCMVAVDVEALSIEVFYSAEEVLGGGVEYVCACV